MIWFKKSKESRHICREYSPESVTQDERIIVLVALILGGSIAALPLPPATDWPQHLALATSLQRLWHGDPNTLELFAFNPATHNAGVHLLLASFPSWISPMDSGRVLLGVYPLLLLSAVLRLLRRLRLPAWRALLLVPAILGFCFGWGLINFCLGTALAWLLLDGVLAQIEHPRLDRAVLLALGSFFLGITHVFAMLLACIVALVVGLEKMFSSPNPRQPCLRALGAGVSLLPGCIYDIHVYLIHISIDTGAYTSPILQVDEPSFFRKIGLLGALLSGLFTSYADTVIAWCILGLLGILAIRAYAKSLLLSPLLVLLLLYFIIPSVFFNTHLIFQRIPLWILLAAVLALPPLTPALNVLGRRWALLLSGAYLLLLPLHLAWHHLDARGAIVVLRKVPPGVCVTGVIEEPRTLGVRLHTLTHAAAFAVPMGAAEDSFSFARWMGLPVVYKPGHQPMYPESSWEHDGYKYNPESPLARRCPIVLVHSAWRDEPTDHLVSRIFRAQPARTLAANEGWWLMDTRP